jgi:hypothetical protein
LRVFFRHLDAPAAIADLVLHGDAFVHRSGVTGSSPLLGIVVLALWIAAAECGDRRGTRRRGVLDGADLREDLVLPHALGVGHAAHGPAVDRMDDVVADPRTRDVGHRGLGI